MILYSNRLLLALACGMMVSLLGCDNTKPSGNSNAQRNDEKTALPTGKVTLKGDS
jgi:hypothetical protein